MYKHRLRNKIGLKHKEKQKKEENKKEGLDLIP